MLFLVGMLALVIDISWLYYQKIRINSAVNAAWRAGMDEIIMSANNGKSVSEANVIQRAKNVYAQNGFDPQSLQVTFPTEYHGRGLRTYGITKPPLFFANFVTRDRKTGEPMPHSVDALRTGLGGEGMIPLCLVPGDIKFGSKETGKDNKGNPIYQTGYWYNPFDYHDFDTDQGYVASEEYILKLGPQKTNVASAPPVPNDYNIFVTGGGNSNEGSLDLGGQGAANWLENMLYGYAGSLSVGDYVNTAQGEVTNKTIEGREYRAALGDMVTVPIIKVVGEDTLLYNTGGSKTLVIVGFARVVISSIEETDYDVDLGQYTKTQIRGRFVDYLVRPTKDTLELN